MPLGLTIPVGSTEQHGPHLPLDTDTRIATAVAREVTARLTGTATSGGARLHWMVAPPIAYGDSGEHQSFPGTISIGTDALTTLLLEYGRSATCWAQRLLFVNGHGGNVTALGRAVSRLRYEGRDAAWCACAVAGADAHAGHTETSVLLHISPADVLHRPVACGQRCAVVRPTAVDAARGSRGGQPGRSIGRPDHGDRCGGRADAGRDGRRLPAPDRTLGTRGGRDADMTQTRLPDGFAVQVDRRVRVLGQGATLLGGSPTRLLRLAPAAQDMLADGRLKVRDAVSAELARTLLDATVAHPRPAGGPSHRDVTVVIPVRDNAYGLQRLVASLRDLRIIVVDDGSSTPIRARRLRGGAHRHRGSASCAEQGSCSGA